MFLEAILFWYCLAGHFTVHVMNGESRNQRGRWLVNLLAVAVVASLLYRFFDRVAVFHDQVINTGRVGVGLVCNYALRPLFYLLLKFYVFVGGQDLRSVAFAGLLISGMIGWIQYRKALVWFGWTGALSSLVVCVWMGWLYPIAATGMPHVYPGLFGMVAFILAHDAIGKRDWKGVALATFSVWLGLACHPTGIAYVAAFYLLVGFRILYNGLRENVLFSRVLELGLPSVVVGLSSLSVLEVVYRIWGGKGYLSWWVTTFSRVQYDDSYSEWHASVFYYLSELFDRYWLLIALVVGMSIVTGLIRMLGKAKQAPGSGKSTKELVLDITLYTVAVVSLYSMSSWRIERVLVGFCALFGYCWVVYIYSLLAMWRRFGKYAGVVVFVILTVVSFDVFLENANKVADEVSEPFRYTGPVARLKYGTTGDLLFLGKRNIDFHRVSSLAHAAGRKAFVLDNCSMDELGRGDIVEYFTREGYGWLAYRVPANLDEQFFEFRRYISNEGFMCSIRYSGWGGLVYEIWEYLPLKVSGNIESCLIGHTGRVGFFEDGLDGKIARRALEQGLKRGVLVSMRHRMKQESIRKRIESRRLTGFVVGGLSKDVEDRVENLLMDAGFELRATGPLIQGVDTEYRFWTKSVSE